MMVPLDLPRGPRVPPPGWRDSDGLSLPPHAGRVSLECGGTIMTTGDRRRSAAFNPSTLPHLAAWDLSLVGSRWQDTAATTAATSAGQTLARIDDWTGHGAHLVQATSGARPALSLTAGPTGDRPGATYAAKRLTTTVTLSTVECTVVVVARHDSGGLWARGNNNDDDLYRPSGATLLVGFNASRGGSALVINDATMWAASGTYAIYSVVITPAATTKAAIFRNTTAYATSATACGTTALVRDFTIGATTSGGSDPGSGTWLEAGIGTYSSAQLSAWVSYLMTKWGISP